MRYCLLMMFVIVGCNSREIANCTFSGWEKVLLPNSASIEVPKQLSVVTDSLNHNFEIDPKLLFARNFYSKDRLSRIHFESFDSQGHLFSRKGILMYSTKLQQYYKSVYKYSNSDYAFNSIDTVGSKTLSKFIFSAKIDSVGITVGVLVFYDGKVRHDISVQVNELDIRDSRTVVKCILNSLEYVE